MLLTKAISGFVLGGSIIASVVFFKFAWLLMVILLSITGSYELFAMLRQKGYRVVWVMPMLMNIALHITVYLLTDPEMSLPFQAENWTVAHAQVLTVQNMMVAFSMMIMLCSTLFFKPRSTILELIYPLLIIVYLGWFPSYFILLRSIPQGGHFLIWALTSVAFSDIGAYFAGKYLGKGGKHPFFPHLSPNKTIEGSLGGIACCMSVAGVWSYFLPMPWYHTLVLSLGLACLGQISDLLESMLKRDIPVKDSGNIIPGHGGVLDRVDSYLLLGPYLYFYLAFFVLV